MSDMRQEYRMQSEDCTAFLDLADENASSRYELLCLVTDISANGLQLSLDRKLPDGAIYRCRIKRADSETFFELVGEIAWCVEAEAKEFTAGMSLLESSGSDIVKWKESFGDLL